MTCVDPGLPTINLTSDIKSLLNIAALRSLTVGFVACQFGSRVPNGPGDRLGVDGGDDGALAGCKICSVSLWAMRCGGDKLNDPLFKVSAVRETQIFI